MKVTKKTKPIKQPKPSQKKEEVSLVKWPLKHLKHENFCQAYASNPDTYWNATASYALVYGMDASSYKDSPSYDTCRANWARLLANASIRDRVDEIRVNSLVDFRVDSKMASILYGWKDEVSLSAIKEYNRLRQRITDKTEMKIEWTVVDDKRLLKLEEMIKNVKH